MRKDTNFERLETAFDNKLTTLVAVLKEYYKFNATMPESSDLEMARKLRLELLNKKFRELLTNYKLLPAETRSRSKSRSRGRGRCRSGGRRMR